MVITFSLFTYEQTPYGSKWVLYLYLSITIIGGGLIAEIKEKKKKELTTQNGY
jgi:hypothetical protein